MTTPSLVRLITTATLGFSLAMGVQAASAQTYKAVAVNFVGTAAQCSPSPAGAKIVTSLWSGGLGLPDNGGLHPQAKINHEGLVLSKNGPTPNCSAATATITVNGAPLTEDLDTIGFDYRNGTSCGAGAPRFNVYTTSGTLFFGCSGGTLSPAPQNPAEWTRVTHSGLGLTGVTGVEIIFDEGTDTALPPDAAGGPGLVTIDNIRINTTFIRRKAGNPFTP